MKKNLLLAAMMLAGVSAFAANEGKTYDNFDGYTFTNLYMNSSMKGDWNSYEGKEIPSFDYVATATVFGDKIYVASSKSFAVNADGEVGLDNLGQLIEFDKATGAYIRNIVLTIDGVQINDLLCVNTVSVDDFGHMYVCGYKQNLWAEASNKAVPLNVYIVDPATGALTLAASVEFTEDDRSNTGRTDYIDVVGDLTRQNARCVIMTALSAATEKIVCGWAAEQGDSEFAPHLYGGDYVTLAVEESYPAADAFNGGTALYMLRDDEYSGELFYIDDFHTKPCLYNTEGAMLSSFADYTEADPELPVIQPSQNPNGMCEFQLGDDFFLMYPYEEYDNGQLNRARLTRYGVQGDFATLQPMYNFPQIGLGDKKGAGRRYHVLRAEIKTDANGKQAAEIFNYKTGNGFALYQLAQPGYNGAGVEGVMVSEDANAPVEFFNLQGIRVENPANGVFVRRQGSTVTKVVL